MTTSGVESLRKLLAQGSLGGFIDLSAAVDEHAIRTVGAESRARVAFLRRPASKQELLSQLAEGLALPSWFGHNWDALDEVLAWSEPDLHGPVLIVWTDPDVLEGREPATARTFRTIVESAFQQRNASGYAPLVLAVAQTEQTFDLLVAWTIDWTAGVEAAWVSTSRDGLIAQGQCAAQRPQPYTARYRLDASDGFRTLSLHVVVEKSNEVRELTLAREGGEWTENGAVRADLGDAVDCDVYASPLTNTMPILRHELHARPGEVHLTMAFVELPTLRVVRSVQTYTHLRALDDGGAMIRYRSDDFAADLTVDADGVVVDYPILGARRIAAS